MTNANSNGKSILTSMSPDKRITHSGFSIIFFSFIFLGNFFPIPSFAADYPPIPAVQLPAAPTIPVSQAEIAKAVAADPKALEANQQAAKVDNLITQALASVNSNTGASPAVSLAKIEAAVTAVKAAASEAKANADKAVEVAKQASAEAEKKSAVADAAAAKAVEAIAAVSKAVEAASAATQQAQVATQQAQVATQQAQVATQKAQVATQQAEASAKVADKAFSDYQEALAAGRLRINPLPGESSTAENAGERFASLKFTIASASTDILTKFNTVKMGPIAEKLKIISDEATKIAEKDKKDAEKANADAKAAQEKADQAKAAADKATADAKAASAAADKAKLNADLLKSEADKLKSEAAEAQAAAAQSISIANAKQIAAQAAAQLALNAAKKLDSLKKNKSVTKSLNSGAKNSSENLTNKEGLTESPKPAIQTSVHTRISNFPYPLLVVSILSVVVIIFIRVRRRKINARLELNSTTGEQLNSQSDPLFKSKKPQVETLSNRVSVLDALIEPVRDGDTFSKPGVRKKPESSKVAKEAVVKKAAGSKTSKENVLKRAAVKKPAVKKSATKKAAPKKR